MPEECAFNTKILKYLRLITVEPTLVLYMMAFMTTTVVEQDLFIYKACRVNHHYNDTICRNINNKQYENITKQVQRTVSDFLLWNDVAGHSGQIILALFMGAWSDKRGRKLPLLIGLIGKFYYSVMVVVNSMQDSWPVEYIIYTATLPMAFTGADVAIFAAAFTYLVDVSPEKYRTLRVTLLEVCYLATMPAGIALGSYLFQKVTNRSHSIMFTINCCLMAISILYTFFILKWRTNDRQRPLSEANNILLDFFDKDHLTNTAKTIFKKRPNNQRTYLLLLILMMAMYTFQRNEKDMMYMYLQLVFNWSFGDYSQFKTFQSALQDVLLLVTVPFVSNVLGWRDTIIAMIGALFSSTARIFYSAAKVDWMFYIGGGLAAVGPIIAPVIRSIVSKLVANSEKGKTFAILSVADNAIPLIAGTCYSKLYNATIELNPHAIFYLTMATQITVFLLISFIHFKTTNADLCSEEKNDRNPEARVSCLEENEENPDRDLDRF